MRKPAKKENVEVNVNKFKILMKMKYIKRKEERENRQKYKDTGQQAYSH